MSVSLVTPPPFQDINPRPMTLGYVDDGSMPPSGLAYSVGNRAVALSFEQLQRWQCRPGYWDWEAQVSDPFGMLPTITRNYGDGGAPTDGFPDFFSRIRQTYTAEIGADLDGTDTVVVRLDMDLCPLSNSDQTLFYPRMAVIPVTTLGGLGKTLLITDMSGGSLGVSTRQEDATWVPWGVGSIGVSDGLSSFSIPIWRQPDSTYSGTPTERYDLDYFNIKPTQYLLT